VFFLGKHNIGVELVPYLLNMECLVLKVLPLGKVQLCLDFIVFVVVFLLMSSCKL